MLRDLFAEGALSAAFVSTFSRTLNQKGEREAWRLANLVNNGLIVILSVIVVLGHHLCATDRGLVGSSSDARGWQPDCRRLAARCG
jgi:putative peptidoglycan lipid II flippase